ncbi:MAG: ABC transporter permease, partial [Candidatus Latescibacteria bacterium]|nr:ABC transporter permease [Candidatus Latescibacterota bacterium]
TVSEQFNRMGGASSIRVNAPNNWIRKDNRWIHRDWDAYLTNRDAERIAGEIEHLKYIVPIVFANRDIRNGKASSSARIRATNEYYHLTQDWKLARGRFLSAQDVSDALKVAVIGPELAKDLFGDENPVGREIKLGGERYTVIGLLERKKFFGSVNERNMVIPFTTAQKRMYGNDRLGEIYIVADAPEYVPLISERIRSQLKRQHDHGEEYRIRTGENEIVRFNRVVTIMKIVAGGIAGISLLVGGIGIMNIMLVSVTERTREIGIRKALGATRRAVMSQFLIEAMVLCLFGGALGILLGLGIGAGISAYVKKLTDLPFESIVTPGLMAFAIMYSAIIGLFFGVYPAWRASKLDPIDALRYE